MINCRSVVPLFCCLLLLFSTATTAEQAESAPAAAALAEINSAETVSAEIVLKLGGTPPAFAYITTLLSRSLALRDRAVQVTDVGDVPTTRLEVMLLHGEVSAFILGRTARRDQMFLPVDVGMTDGLVNRRILFIPKGSQSLYDEVETLDDFRNLGKVAGLGVAWADREIWAANELPLRTIDGDWKRLYQMIVSENRGMDYLPRGAQEIALEWPAYPDLQVERNLVLVYDQDHIMYVSPTEPELHALLQEVLVDARDSGLIAELAASSFADVYKPPVNLDQRRVIHLPLSSSPHDDSLVLP